MSGAFEMWRVHFLRLEGLAQAAGFGESGWEASRRRTDHGSALNVYFHEDSSRYRVESEICPSCDGWKQFDTDQDAWYYGVWVNPSLRAVVCFAEGDLYIQVSSSKEQFSLEIESLTEFHGEPPVTISALDSEGVLTRYRAERPDYTAV